MPETIGQQLKNARQAKGLTIEKVVQATHIRLHYIQAIEADDFDSLPSPVQARGFLRLYAEHLGLSLDELIARQRGSGSEPQPEIQPPPAAIPSAAPEDRQPAPPAESGKPSEAENVPPAPAEAKPKKPKRSRKKTAEPLPQPDSAAEVIGGNEEAGTGTPSPTSSQALFLSIGEELRQQREVLGLSLDEIERHTHVRKRYLQSLEAGDFAALPSSVQGRGMLLNYARFLDLDTEAVLNRYADGLQAQRLERMPKPKKRAGPRRRKPQLPQGIRRYLSIDLIVGGGLIILLLAFAIWEMARITALRTPSTPQATAPSISDVILSPAAATQPAGPTQVQGAETLTPTVIQNVTPSTAFPTTAQGRVQVTIIVLERTWLRVTVDGEVKLEGRGLPGAAYNFNGEQRIEVLTGNGKGLQIIYNQVDMGMIGLFGEVVDLIFTASSVQTPTATASPTPTITPPVTVTSTPTATKPVTPTATP